MHAPKRKVYRVQLVIVTVVSLGAVGVSVALFLGYRLELFVLPARLQEVMRLQALEEVERSGPGNGEHRMMLRQQIDHAANELVRLQRPRCEEAEDFRLEPVRTHEGYQAFVLTYRRGYYFGEGPEFVQGRHFQAMDTRGRLLGEEFQVPPWPNALCCSQGYWKAEVEGESPDILLVSGDEGYVLSVDSRGIVPRGVIPQGVFGGPPHFPGPLLSSSTSTSVRRWLASLLNPLPSREDVQELLRSPLPGDLFRALLEIERMGPTEARLARPLLSSPDPPLRARAAAVVGNDESLWADLAPLISDTSPFVADSARLALLRARDEGTARQAFLQLLRAESSELSSADFDMSRLLSPEVASALLDLLKKNEYAPEMFSRVWNELRAEDLRPLAPRLLDLWNHGTRSIARWLVLLDDPSVDPLLIKELEDGCREHLDFGGGAANDVLAALLDRSRPLYGEGAVGAVIQCSESADGNSRQFFSTSSSRGSLAHLVLFHWKVPGAADRLLSKLRDPENSWLSDPIWETRLPRELLPALEDLVREQPDRFRERVNEIVTRPLSTPGVGR